MLEVAAAEGATEIEAGIGAYEYKDKLNARTLPLHSVVLCRSKAGSRGRRGSRLRSATCSISPTTGSGISRFAPRVGILRRPLWRSWIRRHF